jgi:sorbitol-specific phosphotransferase system component IIBC
MWPFNLPDIRVTWDEFKLAFHEHYVGGMLRCRRSRRKKHLQRILSIAMLKLSPIKLRHNDLSQDEGVNRLKDEMTNKPMIVCVMIVIDCKGHKCNFTQAAPCAYK